jgi:cytochrome c-type biogenesis protein CcmH
VREIVLVLTLAMPFMAWAGPFEAAREQAIAQQLRCLVCQNQTIAESDAQLAIDLRARVREQLAQGSSDQEIISYMVARYGDFVLYRPPLKPVTWPLWFGPFILLAAGVGQLYRIVRRQGREAA